MVKSSGQLVASQPERPDTLSMAREIRIDVRMTEDEKSRAQAAARSAGTGLSNWVRTLIARELGEPARTPARSTGRVEPEPDAQVRIVYDE